MKNGKHTSNDGTQEWYQNGKRHRDDGPAMVYPSGTEVWYQNGKRHRDDGPAVVYLDEDGNQRWYQNGKRHRYDGPAEIWVNGTEVWYQNGTFHRDDGPAVSLANGTEYWYHHDVELSKAEIQKIKNKTSIEKVSTITKENNMPGYHNMIKSKANNLRSVIKPYEQYLLVAALLITLDHFLLKGALRGRIHDLGLTLGNKFTSILDKAIDKIGPSEVKTDEK